MPETIAPHDRPEIACTLCFDMGYDTSGQPCSCTYKPRRETPVDQYPGIFRAIFRRPIKSD